MPRCPRLAHLCRFAQSLIGIARPLYAQESFGVDLQETVYALDTTTIGTSENAVRSQIWIAVSPTS